MQPDVREVDAVVLAGGINTIPLYEGYVPGYKALLPIQGRPAVCYTLDALRRAPAVRRVCLVGPGAELRGALNEADSDPGACDVVPGAETLVGSLLAGLRHFADSPLVLVTTADLPLLSGPCIQDFLNACSCRATDYAEALYLSLVPARAFTGPYAAAAKAFNRFRDGAVCHGNVALADPRILENPLAAARMNQLYAARKSSVGSALAIGLRVGLSYVLGVHMLHLLTLDQMARIASRRFGLGFVPVLLDRPEVTIDVDEPADYQFVTARLAELARLGAQPTPAT